MRAVISSIITGRTRDKNNRNDDAYDGIPVFEFFLTIARRIYTAAIDTLMSPIRSSVFWYARIHSFSDYVPLNGRACCKREK